MDWFIVGRAVLVVQDVRDPRSVLLAPPFPVVGHNDWHRLERGDARWPWPPPPDHWPVTGPNKVRGLSGLP
jgi:hypothetical protein